MLILKFEFRF